MQKPNEHGVYQPTACEEVVRVGHAYATVKLCQCEDGLYRYSLDVTYSYGGFSGPIFGSCPGFESYSAAKMRRWQNSCGASPPRGPVSRRASMTNCAS